ncbi:MAG: extracellular solute-binding protein [Fimbriimonas sp.]|nr:extracellular solute-binding protein [Fimbriimonas sp.]
MLLVLAVIAVLAPPSPPELHHPGRIKVIFWHAFAGEWQPIYEGMVARFNASQTKYEVVPVSVPGDALTMKFLLSSAGGATPDILLDWDPILGTWTDKGLIRSYDSVMSPEERRAYLAETYPIVKRNSMYKGKIMAMIDGLDFWAVYYRLDHLKEVGVDKDHLPKSLEELVELGKRLDRYDDQHRLRRVGFLPQGLVGFAPAFGGGFNKNGRIVVDTPENLRAMQFLGQIQKRLGYDTITRFTSSLAADAGPNMPLIAGNYSIMFDGEWRVKQVAQYKPDLPYIVAPLPAPAGGKPNACNTAPNYLVIPTAAKCPKGAWEFAKYCVGIQHPEEGGRHMGEMGWVPDNPSIARSKAYQAYLRKYPQYKVFVDLMTSPNLGMFPQGSLQKFVTDEISKAEDGVLRGTLSPENALKTVETHLDAERERLRKLGQPVLEGRT